MSAGAISSSETLCRHPVAMANASMKTSARVTPVDESVLRVAGLSDVFSTSWFVERTVRASFGGVKCGIARFLATLFDDSTASGREI
jgi:hypothetical protein